MSSLTLRADGLKFESKSSNSIQAAAITHSASKQTYFTIRLLVDRDRVADAYRAYAYFRWVDDQLDQNGMSKHERLLFAGHQQALINRCYRGDWPRHASDEESMLVELIRSGRGERSGLWSYIQHMMTVMAFDAERRGHLISADELNGYTCNLATAVTEAMHYFIGHKCKSPRDETRYLAVSAAHITHMLRDTLDDVKAGYFNIPREVVEENHIDPRDVENDAYRKWIRDRLELARACFHAGRRYLVRVENPRCRIAGFAYTTRFESVLSAIESDNYHLRPAYPEYKSFASALMMGWSAMSRAFIPEHVF